MITRLGLKLQNEKSVPRSPVLPTQRDFPRNALGSELSQMQREHIRLFLLLQRSYILLLPNNQPKKQGEFLHHGKYLSLTVYTPVQIVFA